MFSEKTQVTDHVEVELRTMTPEEIAYAQGPEGQERQRRLNALPATWYCLAGNKEEFFDGFWIDFIKEGEWLKIVEEDGTLITGKILSVEKATIKLDTQTVLINQKIDNERFNNGELCLLLITGIQVFTDNEESAIDVKKERSVRNGNG